MTRHMLMATATAIARGLSASRDCPFGHRRGKKAPRSSRGPRRRALPQPGGASPSTGRRGTLALGHYAAPPAFLVSCWPTGRAREIVDEACNLPRSAYPNEMRDIR